MAKKVAKEEPQQETPVEEQQPVEEVEKKPSKRKKRKTFIVYMLFKCIKILSSKV